jgi:hypothetical protein
MFQDCNLVMSMPDGERHTAIEWLDYVDQLSDDVRSRRGPGVHSSDSDVLILAATEGFLNRLIDHPDTGMLVDWYFQVGLSICLAWLSVRLGAWLDEVMKNVVAAAWA